MGLLLDIVFLSFHYNNTWKPFVYTGVQPTLDFISLGSILQFKMNSGYLN